MDALSTEQTHSLDECVGGEVTSEGYVERVCYVCVCVCVGGEGGCG